MTSPSRGPATPLSTQELDAVRQGAKAAMFAPPELVERLLATIDQGATLCVQEAADSDRAGPRPVTLEAIMKAVCEHYDVKAAHLQARGRLSNSRAHIRHVGMFLAREYTTASLKEVGEFFGVRDHTSVCYGVDQVKRSESTNSRMHSTLAVLRAKLVGAKS